MTRPEAALIDELEFRSYVHNRRQFPGVSLERWAAIFSNVPEMEERYLDMLSTGNILDVAPQGGTGVSGGVEGIGTPVNGQCGIRACQKHEVSFGHAANASAFVPIVGPEPIQSKPDSEHQASPADSQNSTPLYLLASEIVGVVTKGYEQ